MMFPMSHVSPYTSMKVLEEPQSCATWALYSCEGMHMKKSIKQYGSGSFQQTGDLDDRGLRLAGRKGNAASLVHCD